MLNVECFPGLGPKDFASSVVFLYERTNKPKAIMKRILLVAAALLALYSPPGWSQIPVQPDLPGLRAPRFTAPTPFDSSPAPVLTKFNLDFPGGEPVALVKAIEKATGKPLNVIISPDAKSASAKLPPVKVTDMDVARLFDTLRENTQKFGGQLHELIYQEGFYTKDDRPTDNSLWTFSVYEKQSGLARFNLDFPGGTPAALVAAIQKATGKPLNAIISAEDGDTQLPPLKMDDVNVSQLFEALQQVSVKSVTQSSSGSFGTSYSTINTSYGFKTMGQASDNCVWYFQVSRPPQLPVQKVIQYYCLASYLDHGFTVDDITTAIQTGWKLAGINPVPDLNYHKETKLLIAYGESGKLATIDQVLRVLPTDRQTATQQRMQNLPKLTPPSPLPPAPASEAPGQ